jgi:predicted SprT family Zn-dependent metalloprotease
MVMKKIILILWVLCISNIFDTAYKQTGPQLIPKITKPKIFNQAKRYSITSLPKNVGLPVPWTSQSFYNEKQKISPRSKWAKRAFLAALLGQGIYTGNEILKFMEEERAQYLATLEAGQTATKEEKRQYILNNSDDLSVVNPLLYEVCLQIKKDYGIAENIDFRVAHSGTNFILPNAGAVYFSDQDMIIFSSQYKNMSKPRLIHLIAHELEHFRQKHKYPTSFHENFEEITDWHLRAETAAEAAALDYQYCQKCLSSQSYLDTHTHEPHENEYGYFSSKTGYMTWPDLKLYVDRARKDCALCPAHQKYWFASLRNDIPLSEYLPTIKPSLPTAKFKDLLK